MTDEEAKKLAERHWDWVQATLKKANVSLSIELIEHLYISAMVHGIKHEREELNIQ